MKTTVTKGTHFIDDIIEVATLGALKAEPVYTAHVQDGNRSATAESNREQAAVASALDKLNHPNRTDQ